jgi:hypothetical protein
VLSSLQFFRRAFPAEAFLAEAFLGETFLGEAFPGEAFPGEAFPGEASLAGYRCYLPGLLGSLSESQSGLLSPELLLMELLLMGLPLMGLLLMGLPLMNVMRTLLCLFRYFASGSPSASAAASGTS